VSFKFYPNGSKTNKKTKTTPIYLRLGFDGDKAECRLNVEIPEKDMEQWKPNIMRLDVTKSKVNDYLNNIETACQSFIANNAFNLSDYDVFKIRDTIFNKLPNNQDKKGWMEFLNEYFKNNIEKSSVIKYATVKNYRKAIRHMAKFLELNNLENIKLDEVNRRIANDFKTYLLTDYISDDEKKSRKGMTEVSALGIVKKFRTIFEYAIDEGLNSINHFKKIKLKNISPDKEKLSIYQVKSLYNGDNKLTSKQIIYRDIFLFSVFTGLAYQDAAELKKGRLIKDDKGNIMLSSNRIKTNERYQQYLSDYAIKIIRKYENEPDVIFRGGVIPKRSNKELNAQLKIIAEKFEIPFNLTSHTGRHTFRQLCGESGIEVNAIIKRLMGQTNNKDIDGTYYKVTERKLLEAKEILSNFLKNNLENDKPA
jgi:integrase